MYSGQNKKEKQDEVPTLNAKANSFSFANANSYAAKSF